LRGPPRGRAARELTARARHGIECPAIGAGAATFEFETASGDYTELPCGSHIFMVAYYGRNLDRDGTAAKAFEPILFVWATVMIGPAQDRAIVDADHKALAFDFRPVARSRRDRRQP
jgi:3-hydroxy-D-aspartate aldolase